MKNTQRVQVMSSKQQVSKILMSQAKREIKDLMYYEDAAMIKRSVAAKLCDSAYHKDGSLRSWGQPGTFNFVFEFGRRGGIRISYCNQEGLVSAVYQPSEWENLKYMLNSMVSSAVSRIEDAEADKKRKEEQERFESAVAEAVRKELQKQQWQEKQKELNRSVIAASHIRKVVPDDPDDLY